MKWLNNSESGEEMLAFTQTEAANIAKLLRYARRDVNRKYEHFKGLHEIGEASEKQQNLMFVYGDLMYLISSVLNAVEHR